MLFYNSVVLLLLLVIEKSRLCIYIYINNTAIKSGYCCKSVLLASIMGHVLFF